MGNTVQKAQEEVKAAAAMQTEDMGKAEADLAQLSVILSAKQEEYRMRLKTPDATDRTIPIDTIISLKTDKSVNVSSAPSEHMNSVVEDLFGGNFLSAMKGVILGALDTVIGNTAAGEKEKSGMTVILLHSAVVRVDYYMYSYTMHSSGITEQVKNGMCFVVSLSTVKIAKVNSEAIALLSGMTAETSLGYMSRLANKFNRFKRDIEGNSRYFKTAEAVGLIRGYFGVKLTEKQNISMNRWLSISAEDRGGVATEREESVEDVATDREESVEDGNTEIDNQLSANELLMTLSTQHGITKSDEEQILSKQGELLEAMSEIYEKISVMKRSTQDSMSSADGRRVGNGSNY